MEYIWILPITFVILLGIAAVLVIANEDILYKPQEKIRKIIFIIFVPIIGTLIELRKLDKFARYSKDSKGNDVMDYAFWDYYSTSQASVDIGSSDGGGSGGD